MKKFTKKEVETVRAAIRKAREEVQEWNLRARVDPEKMRQPMSVFRNGRRVL